MTRDVRIYYIMGGRASGKTTVSNGLYSTLYERHPTHTFVIIDEPELSRAKKQSWMLAVPPRAVDDKIIVLVCLGSSLGEMTPMTAIEKHFQPTSRQQIALSEPETIRWESPEARLRNLAMTFALRDNADGAREITVNEMFELKTILRDMGGSV